MVLHATPENPEFYPEILSLKFSGGSRNTQKESYGIVSPTESTHHIRMTSFLNTIARLVISSPEQVAAVAVSIGADTSTQAITFKIYITYNHDLEPDQELAVIAHVHNLFEKMKHTQPPPPLPDTTESPHSSQIASVDDIVMPMLEDIYRFSRSVINKCLAKRQDGLAQARAVIVDAEIPPNEFSQDERKVLDWVFFSLTKAISKAQDDNRDLHGYIAFLHSEYEDWVAAGYIGRSQPNEPLDEDELDEENESGDNDMDISDFSDSDDIIEPGPVPMPRRNLGLTMSLFKRVEEFMVTRYRTRFPLEGWIRKILSLHVACLKLVQLRTSVLRTFMEGTVDVEILPTLLPTHDTLSVDLNENVIRGVISSVRQRFGSLPVGGPSDILGNQQYTDAIEDFQKFILKKLGHSVDPSDPTVVRSTQFIHCEVCMAYYIHLRDLPVFSYIGVSTLSCAQCMLYLEVFSDVLDRRLTALGSHNKFYPAWAFPTWDENIDGIIRDRLVEKLQGRLASTMIQYIKSQRERRRSDSTAASDSGISGRGVNSLNERAAFYRAEILEEQRLQEW